MSAVTLDQWLHEGESQTLEFKSSFDNSTVESLVAFAGIFSPGTFHGGLTVADIQADNYRSSLRNKLVAEGFYLINAIEKYGSGFIRIRKALLEYPEITFSVEEKFGGIMATFVRQAIVTEDVSGGVSGGVSEGVSGGVSGGVSKLLDYINTHPGQRVGEIADALGISVRTTERRLKQMRENGLIEYRGAPKTGGYYPKGR